MFRSHLSSGLKLSAREAFRQDRPQAITPHFRQRVTGYGKRNRDLFVRYLGECVTCLTAKYARPIVPLYSSRMAREAE